MTTNPTSEEAIAANFNEAALAEADRIAARISVTNDCPKCHGDRLVPRQRCYGFTDPDEELVDCPKCGGSGVA